MKKIHETDSEVFLLKEPDPDLVNKIQSHFKLTELTSKIIANRGLNTMEEISSFLSPALKNLPSPFLFQDMPFIVERIQRAISENESVLIYGDFDVDGVTSTALLLNFFKYIDFPVKYYIPNRFHDGYGLNIQRLKQLYKTSPFTLLITVDCGSSSESVIRELTKFRIDTIVTDHHQAKEKPASAFGTLNPSIPGCPFPSDELAGVGVAFFLLIALRSHLRNTKFWEKREMEEPNLKKFLDIVCIGTVADMVPIKEINRVLINTGLTILSKTENMGLRFFLKGLGLYGKQPISPWEIAFQIAPRFNAAGRLKDASICVSLLTTNDTNQAASISGELETLNSKRQQVENELLNAIDREIESEKGFISPHAIVLWGEKWHEGVIGIGSSKLVERFGRPVALISMDREYGKGSLRGIPDTDIFKALCQCEEWLDSFGGHPMAGGLKIHRDNLLNFSEEFSEAIRNQLKGQIPKKKWEIDALVNREIPHEFFLELSRLEPFGIGNPPPLLALQDFKILHKKLLKEKHIRVNLGMEDRRVSLQGIAFNASSEWERIDHASGMIGIPSLNIWNGNATPQINIKRFLYVF